jgi:eukaryotic-like serine/threonine-protein kinase
VPKRTLSDGRYELESLPLARGGMGEVWLGRDTKLDREVAVKFVRFPDGVPEENLIRRFVRESRITARLEHPGVPAVYDVGTDGGRPFLVMQRVHGISVADLIAEQGTLPIGWAAAIAAQVCAVLTVAHAASLVHRDLKPRNLMLEPDGCVKVLDFGLAVAPTLADFSRITATGETIGSPAYMAPEQVEADLSSPATDLYALGCTLHEMLAGDHVFSGSTSYSVMAKQVKDAPIGVRTFRPDVPAGLERLVLDLLEKQPEVRPAGADEVYRRLLPFVADLGVLPGALDPPTRTSPVRMYAGVLNRVYTGEEAPAAAPRTPLPRTAACHTEPPAVSRNELVRSRGAARELVRQSRFSEAADLLRAVVRSGRETFGDTDTEVVQTRYQFANTLFEGGDYRGAAPVYRALTADLEAGGAASRELSFPCRAKEATCYALTGRTGEALRILTALLEDHRKAFGDADPRTLELRKQIGLLELGAGQRQAAKRTLTELLGDVRRSPGDGHPMAAEVAGLLTTLRRDDDDPVNSADAEWLDVLRYVNSDEPGIDRLLRNLSDRRLPRPVVGYELGDSAWPAELAWPEHRIAVVLSGPADDPETADRNAAYRVAGWDARTAEAWTADELAAQLTTKEE